MTTIQSMQAKRLFCIVFLTVFLYSCGSDDTTAIISDSDTAIDDSEVTPQEDDATTTEEDGVDPEDSTETTEDSTTTEDATEEDVTDTPEEEDATDTEDTTEEEDVTDTEDAAEDTTEEDTAEAEDTADEDVAEEEAGTGTSSCDDPSGFIFNERNGLVLVEFENTALREDWTLENTSSGYSGAGYLVWKGSQYFNDPGNGVLTYNIKIETPGTYQFIWHTEITNGENGTEHNDTWLRFDDADDFYGDKVNGDGVVYPNDRGKSPNPKGSSSDGWFKVYRSGGVAYQWNAYTSDNSAHNIFVQFDSPGTYLMEVSARSSYHAIDKFVLFNSNWSEAEATSSSAFSVISCD